MSDTIKVVCAIIEQNGKFLAARRKKGQSQAGLWEFPGGKIRDDETPQQALKREILEEMEVTIEVGNPLSACRHSYPSKNIELIPFICTLTSSPIKLNAHDAIKWVDAKTAKSLEWAPADIPVLREYTGRNDVSGSCCEA
jgi:8-oxo-dGTP diphosphatase